MRIPSALALCGALALVAPAAASPAGGEPALPSESFTLANGMRVVLHEDHSESSSEWRTRVPK